MMNLWLMDRRVRGEAEEAGGRNTFLIHFTKKGAGRCERAYGVRTGYCSSCEACFCDSGRELR